LHVDLDAKPVIVLAPGPSGAGQIKAERDVEADAENLAFGNSSIGWVHAD
jgi:hypothetical protein